jgi:hypothetical protein
VTLYYPYIRRHLSKSLEKAKNTFPSVLVTGARQVGKSTLLKQTFSNVPFISLDDFTVLDKLKDDPMYLVRENAPPIIFDEVQYAPTMFRSIKLEIDKDRRNGMYFMTGSQAFALMKGVSESLAGRVAIFDLLGLSEREINGDDFDQPFLPTEEYFASRKPKCASVDLPKIWERIHRGSMPELYANKDVDWTTFYREYFKAYIERDVRALEQVGDEIAFAKFVTALAARTGELLNMASISKDIGISQPTVKKWLSVLQASNIVTLLQPFSLNAKTRIAKTPKVYFNDTGLVCYLCSWNSPDALKNGAQAGNIFETYVVAEVMKSYYNAGRDTRNIFYYRDNHCEIDLIFWQDGTLYPVEIKKTTTPNPKDIKHFAVLQNAFPTQKIGPGGLICSYDKLMNYGNGNKIIPLVYV